MLGGEVGSMRKFTRMHSIPSEARLCKDAFDS